MPRTVVNTLCGLSRSLMSATHYQVGACISCSAHEEIDPERLLLKVWGGK